MRSVFKLSLMIAVFGILLVMGMKEVHAAYSPFEFAVPIETKRYEYAIALIRKDNTMELIPMEEKMVLLSVAISPKGNMLAYVLRDKDRLTVYTCTSEGKNTKKIADYRSDRRNVQDFIDVQFTQNGSTLVMAKYIKRELAFIEYKFSKGQPRFISKTEWEKPFASHCIDPHDNGLLVFKMLSHSGGDVFQQIWTANVYEEGTSLFMEIEAPPSIIEFVPDMPNKRIFVIGTPTRHVMQKSAKKSLILIDSMEDEPETLLDVGGVSNLILSHDRKSVLWQTSNQTPNPEFKRYNVETGEVTNIPAAPTDEESSGVEGGLGTIKPGS